MTMAPLDTTRIVTHHVVPAARTQASLRCVRRSLEEADETQNSNDHTKEGRAVAKPKPTVTQDLTLLSVLVYQDEECS